MIELGRLRIETEASIVDARSKIGALARSLGFDVVTWREWQPSFRSVPKARENHEHFHLDMLSTSVKAGRAGIDLQGHWTQLSALASIGFDRVQERQVG